MDTLPQEMTDRVLDFLFNNRKALTACGQACSHWLPGSRYYLFATITLQTLAWSHVETQRDLNVLCSPGSTVHRYVQALRIDGFHGKTNSIFGHLPKFPILRRLDLDGIDLYRLSIPAQKWIENQVDTITSLSLSGVHFHSHDAACRLVAAAHQLKSFKIGNIWWITHSADPLYNPKPPPISSCLSLKLGGKSFPFIRWMAQWREISRPPDLILRFGDLQSKPIRADRFTIPYALNLLGHHVIERSSYTPKLYLQNRK